MVKIAINTCYGGFGLSVEATQWLWDHGVKEIGTDAIAYHGGPGSGYYEKNHDDEHWKKWLAENLERWHKYQRGEIKQPFSAQFTPDEKFCLYARDLPRDHPKLIKVIELMGEAANGDLSRLEIIEVPDGVQWEISDYDGIEHVAEVHRRWG
jgi:hypothetical protein